MEVSDNPLFPSHKKNISLIALVSLHLLHTQLHGWLISAGQALSMQKGLFYHLEVFGSRRLACQNVAE